MWCETDSCCIRDVVAQWVNLCMHQFAGPLQYKKGQHTAMNRSDAFTAFPKTRPELVSCTMAACTRRQSQIDLWYLGIGGRSETC